MKKNNLRSTKHRKPLNRDIVIQTAMKIADNEGIDALSMRRLGHELEVEAMALYHHFENKRELLEALLNEIHDQIQTQHDNDWKNALRLRAKSVLSVIQQHPWAASMMESGSNPGLSTLQDRENMAKIFREAGFTIENTVHAITLLDVYVYGAAQQLVRLSVNNVTEASDVSKHIVEKVNILDFPYFSELLHKYMMTGKYNPKSEFDFGFEMVLDAIARLK